MLKKGNTIVFTLLIALTVVIAVRDVSRPSVVKFVPSKPIQSRFHCQPSFVETFPPQFDLGDLPLIVPSELGFSNLNCHQRRENSQQFDFAFFDYIQNEERRGTGVFFLDEVERVVQIVASYDDEKISIQIRYDGDYVTEVDDGVRLHRYSDGTKLGFDPSGSRR